MSAAIRTVRVADQKSIPTVEDSFACVAGAAIGDLVRASLTIADGVDVASDNSLAQPVIGIIISKPSTTIAKVLLLGQVVAGSGLTKGKQLFLSPTGTFTSTVPTGSGYVQVLGVAINADKVLFNPQLRVVRRNP